MLAQALGSATRMITRDDFDACRFPELRRQLADNAQALQDSVLSTWNDRQLDGWREGLAPRDCPLCSSPERLADVIVSKHGVDVVRCRKCSMVYTNRIAQARHALFTFTNERTAASFASHQAVAAYSQLARRKYAYYLQEAECLARPGMLLDIGCCVGDFMVAGRARHWQPVGIDASEHFAAIARRKGFEVRTEVFPDELSLQPGERFRMISLLDVLEHLHDPVNALKSLMPHLDGDGILMIQVPNFDSPLVALQGAGSSNHARSHWSYFTADTLATAVVAAGFKVLSIQTVITELDLILRYPRDLVESTIRSVVGDGVVLPETVNADWLHEHRLGYKLFGMFSPS